jgi:hypothetical protein
MAVRVFRAASTKNWRRQALTSLWGGISAALLLSLFFLAIVWLNARHPPRNDLAEEVVAER